MTAKSFLTPIQKFIKTESFGGLILFVATILALILANSPLKDHYQAIWQYEIGIQTDNFNLIKPVILWINDGFMAVFFFLVGLEIKREILLGELNSFKKASLPIFAALGGMILPLLFYFALNNKPETADGWGISMATDIAFTLAILQLLGKQVPLGLKIFLTAFAIIDDIGAVLVIALFYTNELSWSLLFYAAVLLLILYYLSYKRIHNKFLIFTFGVTIWVLFLKAGIHPTIAGILLAFAVPIRQKINEFMFAGKLQQIVKKIIDEQNTNPLPVLSKKQIEEIDNIEDWANKVQSPLQQLEHRLHNWIAYMVMPVFAFANAGVSFGGETEIDFALAANISISLFAGKLIGVFGFSFLSVKLKLASLPNNVTFKSIFGIAILSGLGFTMSLFIGNLAFIENPVYLNSAKIGIIAGSVLSGLLGYIVLKFALKPAAK